MKPATTLKELLKPPFEVNGRCIYVGAIKGDDCRVVVLEDHGYFLEGMRYKPNPLTDMMKDFIVQALNEKWERDFGGKEDEDGFEDEKGVSCYDCRKFFVDEKEVCRCKDKDDGTTSVDPDVCEPCPGFEGAKSPRWKFSGVTQEIHCPDCQQLWFVYEDGFNWEAWNYCPSCGQRLLPPENNKGGSVK